MTTLVHSRIILQVRHVTKSDDNVVVDMDKLITRYNTVNTLL